VVIFGNSLVARAQGSARTPLEGAWKVVMYLGDPRRSLPSSPVHPAPQVGQEGAISGLRLFTREHYSTAMLIATALRPQLPDAPTSQQLLQTWAPFSASSGRYEVRADTLIATPALAKNPRQTSRPSRYVFKIRGDTLFLSIPNGLTEVSVRVERSVP
jgi:hypothetical protein